MCGRYALVQSAEDIRKRYHATLPLIEVEKRYNVAPSQMMPTIVRESGEKPHNEIISMRWGARSALVERPEDELLHD